MGSQSNTLDTFLIRPIEWPVMSHLHHNNGNNQKPNDWQNKSGTVRREGQSHWTEQ